MQKLKLFSAVVVATVALAVFLTLSIEVITFAIFGSIALVICLLLFGVSLHIIVKGNGKRRT